MNDKLFNTTYTLNIKTYGKDSEEVQNTLEEIMEQIKEQVEFYGKVVACDTQIEDIDILEDFSGEDDM